jgi:hypothetical protein
MGYSQSNGSPIAQAHLQLADAASGNKAMVSRARPQHLPAPSSACVAHPDATKPLRERLKTPWLRGTSFSSATLPLLAPLPFYTNDSDPN